MSYTRTSTAAGAALVAIGMTFSAPAQAQSAAAFAKTEAILGGASQLEAMLAQQGVVPATPEPSSNYGLRRTLQLPIVRAPSLSTERPSGRPDVFGTVALKVDNTRLDKRWKKVQRVSVKGAAAAYSASLRSEDKDSRIEAVNRYVNGRVQFVDDLVQYRRSEVWTNANETLRRGRGDCEDYAIAKLQMLRVAGFAESDLFLVILKDLVRRSDHAVAVVRSGDRMLVLDNGTDQLLESDSVSDYRPILTFAATGAWTHGYRVAEPRVTIAMNDVEPVPAAQPSDQRSRSASLRAFSTGFSK